MLSIFWHFNYEWNERELRRIDTIKSCQSTRHKKPSMRKGDVWSRSSAQCGWDAGSPGDTGCCCCHYTFCSVGPVPVCQTFLVIQGSEHSGKIYVLSYTDLSLGQAAVARALALRGGLNARLGNAWSSAGLMNEALTSSPRGASSQAALTAATVSVLHARLMGRYAA